jgi:putative spermidine/putrescine transport system permease protein
MPYDAQEIGPQLASRSTWFLRFVKLGQLLVLSVFVFNFGWLLLLSVGSGWSYPRLLPDRIDAMPWWILFQGRAGILRSAATSLWISLLVASVSTALGLWTGIGLRRSRSGLWLYVAYLPFVLSPVTVGWCLLDMAIRLDLASTYAGVVLAQCIFAYGLATIFFCETWDHSLEKRVQLVAGLGGKTLDIWRHAVLPKLWPLIVVAWLQCVLFSWLDYGLVSVIGGGVVPSLTMSLFSYLREASVNQAAQSAIILLLPTLLAFGLASLLLRSQWGKEV